MHNTPRETIPCPSALPVSLTSSPPGLLPGKVASELEEAKIGLQARADQLLRSDQARAAAERELRAANERLGAVEVLLAKLTEEQANLGLEELGAKLQESRARADAAEAEITSLRSQLGDAMARAEQAEETNREQLAARRAAEEGHEERVRVALAEVQDLRGKLEEAKEEAKRESKAFKEEEMRLRAALSEAGQELETVRRDGWGLEADDRGSSSVAEIGELRRELKAALQEAEQSRARVSELMEAASAGGGGTSSDELQAARATAQELRRNLEEHKREADKKSKALKSERAKLLAALEEAEKKTEAQSELEVEAGEMQRRLDAALQEVALPSASPLPYLEYPISSWGS